MTPLQESGPNVLDRLIAAVHPVLAAHRSTDGHVTEDQITAAWAAYDAARRVSAEAPHRLGRAVYAWRFPDDRDLRQYGDRWDERGRQMLVEALGDDDPEDDQ